MTGKVKSLVGNKGFGFIRDASGKEHFFHKADFSGFFDDLIEDFDKGHIIEVEFEVVESKKGPRAGNVRRVDKGVIREITS
jgi:cold shock CspA family protein